MKRDAGELVQRQPRQVEDKSVAIEHDLEAARRVASRLTMSISTMLSSSEYRIMWISSAPRSLAYARKRSMSRSLQIRQRYLNPKSRGLEPHLSALSNERFASRTAATKPR